MRKHIFNIWWTFLQLRHMCLDQDIIENDHSKPDKGRKQKYWLQKENNHFSQFGPTSVFSRSYCIERWERVKVKKSPKPKQNVSSSWPQSLPEARLSYSLVILGLQLILPSLVQSFKIWIICVTRCKRLEKRTMHCIYLQRFSLIIDPWISNH